MPDDVDDLAQRSIRPWLLVQVDRADNVGLFARWFVSDACEDIGRSRTGVVDLEEHVRRHDELPWLLEAFRDAVREWQSTLHE